jgi:AcrR family transcriptional regulator
VTDSTKTRARGEDKRRRLTAAAAKVLHERGVERTTLADIAGAAGVPVGNVYYYFKTKDDLLFAVVEDTYGRLLADLTRACDPALAPVERIRGVYRRIGAIDDHESQVVRLIMREVLVSSKRLARLIARFQRGHFPLVLAAIGDGIADGSIRADLPAMLLLPIAIAVGAIPQFMLNHLAPKLPGPRGNALADTLVELLWHGIGPRSTRRSRPRERAVRNQRRSRGGTASATKQPKAKRKFTT